MDIQDPCSIPHLIYFKFTSRTSSSPMSYCTILQVIGLPHQKNVTNALRRLEEKSSLYKSRNWLLHLVEMPSTLSREDLTRCMHAWNRMFGPNPHWRTEQGLSGMGGYLRSTLVFTIAHEMKVCNESSCRDWSIESKSVSDI